MRLDVPKAVDVGETILGVEVQAMDWTQETTLKAFLVGVTAMVFGGSAAIVAPSLDAPWLSNVGLIVVALGALVSAGASDRYRRG
jgi:hypothetical protein